MRRAIPLARFGSALDDARGLSAKAAAERRSEYGPNDIAEATRSTLWTVVRETVADPMIWFLLGTGSLYAFLGDRTEAITLFAALVPLAGMDAFLHRRTQASTAGLSSRLAVTALVIRDGEQKRVPSTDVVPGDTAIVSAGESFPADGVVVSGAELQADESSLTGEAYPVRKEPAGTLPVGLAEPALDDVHLCFAGTRLLTGRSRVRIAFTGGDTLYGQIVRSAAGGATARTPLQAEVARLVSRMVAVAAATCLVLAGVRLWQGHGWLDAVMSAVTLAVAALPEEFPIALTFFLALGVYRLARRHALVRRAVSVENIGRVTTICSDKTGTITEGRLRIVETVAADAEGGSDGPLRIAAMASRRETGDPLDEAILDEAAARGLTAALPPPAATFPFTEDRRRETAIVQDGPRRLAVTKGSPEKILALTTLDAAASALWEERVERLAGGGQKVIACAWRDAEDGDERAEPGTGYRFAGLLVCEDSVRAGVPEAVERCREAGIHTIMVTGDHVATARDVARRIGLGGGAPRVISGDQLDERLRGGGIHGVDVIARAVPAQKVGLVRALQAQGEVVAVTGDGVNDVPALQAADVGIAMGERGTRSARETASIVLLDDDFGSIVRAIAEGRQLFANLQLAFGYLLVVHIGLVLGATVVPLAGYPLLYLPIHIVWLEAIVHPTAMLAFQELPADGRLRPAPRRRDARLFSGAAWAAMVAAGLALTAVIVAGYHYGLAEAGDVDRARGIAIATLSLTSAVLAAASSRLRTRAAQVVAFATAAGSFVLIQVPALAAVVHVAPLGARDWALALAGSLLAVGIHGAAQETRATSGGPQILRPRPTPGSI